MDNVHLRPIGGRAMLAALAAAAAVLFALLSVPAAQAHSQLTDSDPAADAQLASAPDEVVLTFNEDITDLGTEIVVTGPDGSTEVSEGDTVVEGNTVTQALGAERPAGAYTVTWRVVSADGHPVDGELTFTATDALPAEEPSQESTDAGTAEATESDAQATGDDADSTSGAGATESDDEGGIGAGTVVLIVVAVAVVGGLVAVLVRMMRRRDRDGAAGGGDATSGDGSAGGEDGTGSSRSDDEAEGDGRQG